MALQLPEPDYYTLAEVLKRWDITEAVLFRLAREGKISIGFIPPYSFPVTVFDSCIDDDGNIQTWEIQTEDLGRGTLYTLSDTSENIIFCNGPILLLPDGVPNLERPCDHLKRDFFPLEMQLWPYKTIPWLKSFPESWFLMVPVSAQVEMNNEWHKLPHGAVDLLMVVAMENKCRIPVNQIIIPTSEVHRIEHRQEKTDQAIAKAEAESPIPSQAKRALNTRAKVIGALVQSHGIQLNDRGATTALITKLELQGVALDRDTVKTILDEARGQMEKPN